MEKENSKGIVKRLIKVSIILGIVIALGILLFTNSGFYSIIFLLGAIISISGFLIMIKMIDRILRQGQGQLGFYLVLVLKMAVIAAVFYLVSRSTEGAVLFHILGLSILVPAIAIEGVYQFYRSVSNGRA